jgi:GNAT superfamily N-acetyltransferase
VVRLDDGPAMSASAAAFTIPDLPLLDLGSSSEDRAPAMVQLEVLDLRLRRDRRRFLDVADPLYRGDPNWIAPLRFERMRFLDPTAGPALAHLEIHALIARVGGRDVGRITAHLDRAYDREHGTRAGWFGFFESVDDRAVAHALLAAAACWLRERGAHTIVGPMNFTTNQTCGLLVENFARPPMLETTYNPPYYEDLLTSFGLAKHTDLQTWWLDLDEPHAIARITHLQRLAARAQRHGVVVRAAIGKRFAAECALVFDLYNRAWRGNWGFVPMGRDEALHLAETLRPVVDPSLILIAEVGGEPAGCAVTLPDLNEALPRNGRLLPFGWLRFLLARRRIRHVRVTLLGVVPEFRRRGLEALLCVETAIRCRAAGYTSGELSWTLEGNIGITRTVDAMGGQPDRRYRLLGARLVARS